MAELTNKEIQIVTDELEKDGLTYTELQNELLDHLCCDIEIKMEEGLEFIKALEEVKQSIGSDCIKQIQEDTLLLVNQKYRMMKKFMYILGIMAPSLIIIGTFFKTMHWPGAGIMLSLGLVLLALVYLPVFVSVSIRDTRKKGKKANTLMYIIGMLSGMIFILGALFKIMHWPGAHIMVSLTAIVTVVVFIPMLFINAIRDKENQVQNFTVLIFILSFIAITFMSFALRTSSNVVEAFIIGIEDDIRTEQVLSQSNTDYSNLIDQSTLNPENLTLFNEVKDKANQINTHIDEVIQQLIIESHEDNANVISENGEIDYWSVKNKDNSGIPAVVMLGIEREVAEGEVIQNMLEEYKSLASEILDEKDNKIELALDTEGRVIYDKYDLNWIQYNFEHIPMISAISQLTSIKINVRITEGELIRHLLATQKETIPLSE